MTEHPIVPLELPKGRVKLKNRITKNRLILNLKSKGVEMSFTVIPLASLYSKSWTGS